MITPMELTATHPARLRVGVLEDEQAMRNLLTRILSPEFEIWFAQSGAMLSDAVSKGSIDVILLDILLPGEDGIAIAKGIRARSAIPMILLSGLSSAETIIMGLNVGADDYVTKPFQSQVLQARLRNVMRRAGSAPAARKERPQLLQIGNCKVDIWARTATSPDGTGTKLTEKELQILSALARQPGVPVDRDTLSRLLSGQDWSPTNRCLDVHLSHLRKKLKRVSDELDLITCYRGVGYALKSADLVK